MTAGKIPQQAKRRRQHLRPPRVPLQLMDKQRHQQRIQQEVYAKYGIVFRGRRAVRGGTAKREVVVEKICVCALSSS